MATGVRLDDRRAGRMDPVRLSLLAGWVVLLVYALAFGEHRSSLDRLEDAVRAGDVDAVVVAGPGLPTDGSGYDTQQIHWRQGLVRHYAEVTMWVGTRPGSEAYDGGAVRQGRDIATHLRELAPDLAVTRGDHPGSYGEAFGWRVSVWVGLAAMVLALCTFASLVAGPPTWWATKWAWFWLMWIPLGIPAYLLLSGPTPGIPAPRTQRPWLRGGWAFVIMLVLTSTLPTWY